MQVRLELQRLHLLFGLTVLMGSLGAVARAEIHPYDQRGVSPGLAYDVGDIDQVSLFNGNLNVTIPIGPRFPLDGGLEYGLALSYNSKLWDTAKTGNPQGFVPGRQIPNPRVNAGFGWILTLGQLFPPNSPGNDSMIEWIYLSPDGGEHIFYSRLHPDVTMPGAEYTRDSSYLRMRVISESPAVREIEFPDGTIHRFEAAADWRLTQIRNRFPAPATVSVSYATPGQWVINDSAGRTHRVYTATFDYGDPTLTQQTISMVTRVELAAFGPDPATYDFVYTQDANVIPPCAPDDPDYNSPISVPYLTQVKLPDDDDPADPDDPQSAWVLQYYSTDGAPNPDTCKTGALKQVKLPTLGTIDYSYERWLLPVSLCSEDADPWRDSTGISARTVTPGFNQPAGTWTYARTFSAEPARPSGYCPGVEGGIEIPREELRVTVTTPLADETRHYFSVWPAAVASTAGFLKKDFGLPFTRFDSDAASGGFLSTLACEGSCSVSSNELRKSYVRYEDDGACTVSCADNNRRLATEKTSFYDSLGSASRQVSRSDFDGLGHYRVEAASGDFVAGHTRTVTTDWNSARGTYPGTGAWVPPTSTDPWVLETFSSVKTEETSVETCAGTAETQIAWREACFDAATGFLSRERILRSGAATLSASRTATDLLTVYQQDSGQQNGNVRFEGHHGGDGATLGTGSLCSVSIPSAGFRSYHEYQAGVRSLSRFTDFDDNPGNDGSGAAFAFKFLDQTIDVDSGLPASTRDVSGLQVNWTYDRLGRPREVKPTATHGGAWESFDYLRASGANPAKVRHQTWANGGFTVELGHELVYRDGLGRTGREQRKRHDGQFDERYSYYNVNGWKDYFGEWARTDASEYGLELRDFDPFGRPRGFYRHPLGNPEVPQATVTYFGEREVRTTTGVGSVLNPQGVVLMEPVERRERLDHHGRRIEVREASDGTFPGVATSYAYDVGNRLKRARTDAPGFTADQVRCWEYDRRGLLTSEKHPEVGTSGSGSITYGGYNALGKAQSKTDGPVTLEYVYDPAARLTEIRETSGGARSLKQWTYASANSGSNRKLGRVETAVGFNYPVVDGVSLPLRFSEAFTYSGPGGRATARDVRMLDAGGNTVDRFTHSESFDSQGNRTGVAYPLCEVIPGSEATCPTEARIAFSTASVYSQGLLTQVTDWATGIGYHANGLWSALDHANGVTDLQYLTPGEAVGSSDQRPRPRLLKTKRSGTTLWSSGSFVYDFAGNITALGEPDAGVGELNHLGGVDRFLYDRVERLTRSWLTVPDGGPVVCLFCDAFESGSTCAWSAREPAGGCFGPASPETPSVATKTQDYTFDVYGNITQIQTNGTLITLSVDNGTNRLSGTGTAYGDGRGNLTSYAGVNFGFDALNRMIRRQVAGEGTEYLFLYTADDERILTFVNQAPGSPLTEEFRWSLRDLGGSVLRDYASTAEGLRVANDYVFRGGALLAARDYRSDPDGPLDLHYTLDHLGTPRLVTDSSGTVLEQRKYFPFGEEAAGADPDGPRLRFTGHERDVFNTGGPGDDLDYLHARFRSPLTGRFSSVDPARGNLRIPQSLNRYGYALGNPLRFLDPTGREVQLPSNCGGKADCQELADIRNTIPPAMRMYVQTLTTKDGRVILNAALLSAGARSTDSGNYQALSRVAGSPTSVKFSSTSPSFEYLLPSGHLKKETFAPITPDTEFRGQTLFPEDSPAGRTEVFVNPLDGYVGRAETTAHELLVHVDRFFGGLPATHDDVLGPSGGLLDVSPIAPLIDRAQREAAYNAVRH